MRSSDQVDEMPAPADGGEGRSEVAMGRLVGATGVDSAAMRIEWETIESGPAAGAWTVLLLPGGMCSARSYAEVMAEPSLAGYRLVAATLPGHCGTAPPDDFRTEHYAQITAELAREIGADVVVGFSMGAMVAYEMAVSGLFTGPLVLLGASLSSADEPGFFRGIVHLTSVLGGLPISVLMKGAALMVKKAAVPPGRQAELKADFARNNPQNVRKALQAYLRWLGRDDDPAQRLCDTHLPVWVVHAEKGDGGLTPHERSVLQDCPHVQLVTIPGHVFFLPNDVPHRIAEVIVDALTERHKDRPLVPEPT
jgi:pimeloyl-ACP methyl ester carboxylesterase